MWTKIKTKKQQRTETQTRKHKISSWFIVAKYLVVVCLYRLPTNLNVVQTFLYIISHWSFFFYLFICTQYLSAFYWDSSNLKIQHTFFRLLRNVNTRNWIEKRKTNQVQKRDTHFFYTWLHDSSRKINYEKKVKFPFQIVHKKNFVAR